MVLGPYFTPTVPSGGAAEEIASGPMMFTGLEGPVIEGVTVSVAVMVWLPAVFSVAENVPIPPVNCAFAGRVACASLLVKCTVPE